MGIKIEHNLEFLMRAIAPHILDLPVTKLIKESICYQLFADRLNFLCVGSAGSGAKSSMRFSLQKLLPLNFDYIAPTGVTNVGIRELAISFSDFGLVIIDEMGRLDNDDIKCLWDIMQAQTVKIDKHGYHKEEKTPINILCLSNPKGNYGEWANYGKVETMRLQLPYEKSLLRRFHFNIFTRSYSEQEFDAINRFILKQGKDKPSYDEDFIKEFNDYINVARSININLENEKIPEHIFNFLKNVKRLENYIISPITPELARGVHQIALAKARIRMSEDGISKEDWSGTVDFLIRTLQTGGLNRRLINSLRKR